jgi:hypothetical protein
VNKFPKNKNKRAARSRSKNRRRKCCHRLAVRVGGLAVGSGGGVSCKCGLIGCGTGVATADRFSRIVAVGTSDGLGECLDPSTCVSELLGRSRSPTVVAVRAGDLEGLRAEAVEGRGASVFGVAALEAALDDEGSSESGSSGGKYDIRIVAA